jgi:hypothetical protein
MLVLRFDRVRQALAALIVGLGDAVACLTKSMSARLFP